MTGLPGVNEARRSAVKPVYPWNAPLAAIAGPERVPPLTHEQFIQQQTILSEIDRLPRLLSVPLHQRYRNIIAQQGLREAHHWLVFVFFKKMYPRLKAVSDRHNLPYPEVSELAMKLAPQVESYHRLPDMNNREVKRLAGDIADGFYRAYENRLDKAIAAAGGDNRVIYAPDVQQNAYGWLAQMALQLHVTPLHYQKFTRRTLTNAAVVAAVLRLVSDDYWLRRLKAHRTRWREALRIASGAVSKDRSPYASRQAIADCRAQRQANRDYLSSMDIEDEETGDRFCLLEAAMAGIANPKIRRMELMAQIAGTEAVAEERGDTGMFITLTTPSRYHPTRLTGKGPEAVRKVCLNNKWNREAYSPKDGQRYLVSVWAKIRTAFKDNKIQVYGLRVVEPHHDGTPHWHLLLFIAKSARAGAIDIMRRYALAEDGEEKGAEQYRFECKHMNRGAAVGYIAKYIAKNVDGYALSGETDFETGRPLTDTAAAVTAWASAWRIPQFQFTGLPSRGVYRECRRLPGMTVADRLGERAEQVRFAADTGNFAEYINAQGGPNTPRREQRLQVAREVAAELNAYDEAVKKVTGIVAPQVSDTVVKTRTRKYRLVRKTEEAETAGPLPLKSAISAPRSSVNNCGESPPVPGPAVPPVPLQSALAVLKLTESGEASRHDSGVIRAFSEAFGEVFSAGKAKIKHRIRDIAPSARLTAEEQRRIPQIRRELLSQGISAEPWKLDVLARGATMTINDRIIHYPDFARIVV